MGYQLNPSIETFFLLLNPHWVKEQKKEVIKQLDDFGVNGIAFYAANFPVVEKYYSAFESKMTSTTGDAILKDMPEELMYLFLIILILKPGWLSDLDTISDEEVLAEVRKIIIEFLESDEEIIDALEAGGFSDQAKWQMTALLQQPKQRLTLVFDAINANLAAFEYAYSKLEPEITSLIKKLEEQLKQGDLSSVVGQTLAFNLNTHIIPSVASPLVLMAFDEFAIYGLLINRIFSIQDEALTNSEAILVAKSLSDPSKLDILLALKKGELYNLEIAREMELTPATTSHHMNMLLSAGLVEVLKKNGKAYYRLSVDGIKRYRDWIDDSLL